MTKAFDRARRALILGAALLPLLPGLSFAQDDYPNKPIRIVAPLAAASTVDIVARLLGHEMGRAMGQQFVVENRPGAGGIIGTQELIRSESDGYSIGMISSNHVINPSILKSVPFDSLNDITPISVIGAVPLVLVAHPSFEADSVQELVALAKEKPGEIDYGSSGNGTVLHLAAVLLTDRTGIDLLHVPYKGTGPLANDLVAGHVPLGFISVTAALPLIQAGTLKPLAVASAERVPTLPDVPTMDEAGVEDFNLDSWIALVGPPGLPQPIVDRLYSETKAALEKPEMQKEFATQGLVAIGSDPATTKTFLADELKKHADLVTAAGVTPE